MIRRFRLLVSTLAIAGTALPLFAQQVPNPDPRRTDLLPRPSSQHANTLVATPTPSQLERRIASPIAFHVAGPTVSSAAVGVRVAKAEPARLPEAPRPAESRRNVALMIVGGVTLLAGAVIGDTPGTLIMIGGAGVGIYGLYKYLE